jgi:competence protein ComEA
LPTPTPLNAGGVSGGANGGGGGLVNLNSATAVELDSLPGIGPSKAQAIIDNRPYATVDDLDSVPGIGASTLEQLRPLVTAP